jgi:hypothetical protein
MGPTRRKPLTQSKSCSKDDSRRNKAASRPSLLLVACVALLAAAAAHAQSTDLTVSASSGALTAGLSFRWAQVQDVVAALRQGLESRITFTVRLYEKRRAALPFTQDHLLVERSVSRTAFWDFLDDRYVVESDTGAQVSYAGPEELLASFFTVTDVFLYPLPRDFHRGMYATARAQFEPVRLMPPLTLVSMVGTVAVAVTPWVRKDLP